MWRGLQTTMAAPLAEPYPMNILPVIADSIAELEAIFRDLHTHP